MTVGELKEHLSRMDDDMLVTISVDSPGGYVCPDGCTIDIEHAWAGIDWHGHELVLHPKYELSIKDVEKWAHPS